jgi:RNA polymerase sigma factor (sigma-70 family)
MPTTPGTPETLSTERLESDMRRARLRAELVSLQTYLKSIVNHRLSNPMRDTVGSDIVISAIQAVLLEIDKGDHGKVNEANLKPWTRGVLLNKILKYLRTWYTESKQKRRIDSEFDVPAPIDDADSDVRLYEQAIERLSEEERQLVAWNIDDDLTYAEIARRLGVSPPWAKTLSLRAMTHALEQLGVTVPAPADTDARDAVSDAEVA